MSLTRRLINVVFDYCSGVIGGLRSVSDTTGSSTNTVTSSPTSAVKDAGFAYAAALAS
jgi:hypothetical protein